MKLSIDDSPSELFSKSNMKVSDLVQSISLRLPPNRIVAHVSINGRPVSHSSAEDPMTIDTAGCEAIEIRTADTTIWAANGLDIALSCLERVKSSLNRTVEFFSESRNSDGNRSLVHCLDGLERFMEAMMITRCALKLDYNLIRNDGMSLAQIETQFASILKSILECQEKMDYEAIAERLEYELLTNLVSWTDTIRQLKLVYSSNG